MHVGREKCKNYSFSGFGNCSRRKQSLRMEMGGESEVYRDRFLCETKDVAKRNLSNWIEREKTKTDKMIEKTKWAWCSNIELKFVCVLVSSITMPYYYNFRYQILGVPPLRARVCTYKFPVQCDVHESKHPMIIIYSKLTHIKSFVGQVNSFVAEQTNRQTTSVNNRKICANSLSSYFSHSHIPSIDFLQLFASTRHQQCHYATLHVCILGQIRCTTLSTWNARHVKIAVIIVSQVLNYQEEN